MSMGLFLVTIVIIINIIYKIFIMLLSHFRSPVSSEDHGKNLSYFY